MVSSEILGIFDMKKWLLVLVFGLTQANSLSADTFRSHAIYVPVIGWAAMNSTFPDSEWDISDNFQIGGGYQGVIKRPFWWSSEFVVGVGSWKIANIYTAASARYYFMEGNFMPFVEIGIHYLQLFYREAIYPSASGSFWFGLRPGVGLEVFLMEDLSLQARFAYDLYLNPNEFVRHSMSTKLALAFYF